MNAIFDHKSIRKFKETPVSENDLNYILEGASRASTTGNMQVYSIIVSRSEELKEELWQSHFKQDMVKVAPVILTFCADFNRFNKWCKQSKAEPGYDNFLSFVTASIDALLAAQNAALAAEDKGLGICYLGTTTYMAEKIIEILKLPKFVVPVTTLVVGHPDEEPGLTDRLPMRSVVHYDTYQDYSEQEIDALYKAREEDPFTKELLNINKKETLAQIFTEKRYTKKDNVHFSQQLLSVLEKQGFMNNQ